MMSRKARKGEFGGNWRKDQDTATQNPSNAAEQPLEGTKKSLLKGGRGSTNSLIGKFPCRLGRCSIPFVGCVYSFRSLGTKGYAFALTLSRQSGCRRGVTTASLTPTTVMLVRSVEILDLSMTRHRGEFKTTLHSGE